jgi:DNA polymerase-3 subunit delta'
MTLTVYPWQQTPWAQVMRRRSSLPHALLFSGPEGTGKLEFARKLAQSLACESALPDGAACCACESCRWFAAGMHPDYREMLPEVMRPAAIEEARAKGRNPREGIVIDEVRELADFIHLTAHRRGGRSVVVYPAELMNASAANAILKSLEEPPADLRFMLVSHRPSYLPATVVSRCQHVAMPVPPAAQAEQWLRENGVDNPRLSLAQTGNAPLAALGLNDPEYWGQRKTLLDAMAAPRFDALTLAEGIQSYPLERILGWMQRWMYDLLSVKSAARLRYNPDYEVSLARLAARLQGADLARHLRVLVREQETVRHPHNPRLYVEQLLLSYAALLRTEGR